MGEVVIMNKFFDKSNFLLNDFTDRQKKQSLFVSVLLIVFFLASSFTFINGLYAFTDVIGSIISGSVDVAIKDLIRSVPLLLSVFMSIWTVLLLQATFRNVSPEKLKRSSFKDAICLIAFGGANILYVIIGRIAGIYSSFVEGAPSAIYPLDSVLYSLLFIAIGVLAILYFKKWQEKFPILLPSRPICVKARGAYATFLAFWLLFALFGFAAGLYSIFIYDFVHGYAFYGIMTILAYLLAPCFLAIWEFYYNELKEEKKKELLLPLGIAGVACSLLIVVLYFVSLGTGLDAPSNAGFGMFPVAFAASVNIATMLQVACPLIVAVVALIKGLLAKKAK